MTSITLNGHAYSDDGTAARDMLNGGARTWFLPLVSDTMEKIGSAVIDAAASAVGAANSATNAAASAAALSGTSTSSVVMGAGSKSFVTQAGKSFGNAAFLRIQRHADPSVYLYGRSTAYNAVTGALTVSVERSVGSGTFTDWDIFVTSMAGDTGPAGSSAVPQRTITGADTVVATDNFKLLLLNGTLTLAATAAATLGASFSFVAKNISMTTLATFDPAGVETVDGAGSIVIQPGESRWFFCTGSGWTTMLIDAGLGGILHFQEQQASGVAGATSTAGAFNTRVINTVLLNTLSGASISANQITLAAGTYLVSIAATIYAGGGNKVVLENVTDSTVPLIGGSQNGVGNTSMNSMIYGVVTISASKTFRIRHWAANVTSFGTAASSGQAEVYLNGVIRRLA